MRPCATTRGGPAPARYAYAILFAGVCALLFLGIRLAAAGFSTPAFCASCHVMQVQYVTHRRSAHSRASCVDCHAGRGCGSCHAPWRVDEASSLGRVNDPGVALHEEHAVIRGISCTVCHKGIMHARMDGHPGCDARDSCKQCHLAGRPGTPFGGRQTGDPLLPEGS